MRNLFKKLRHPKILKRFIAGIGILLLITLVIFYEKRRDRVSIDDSIVQAPIISIAPSNPGKLTELDVYEGETIQKGDLLAIVGTESLHADTNGLIISADNQIGGLTTQQTPLIQMIQPEDLRVAGTIDEDKGLQAIRIGQVASFTIDALPGKTFWGYIDVISPSAKQTQLSFSISTERPTQQFVVYVRYNALSYPEIKNGMSAKITVYTATQ